MDKYISNREQQINTDLQLTLKLYLKLISERRYDLAKTILRYGSSQASFGLDLYKIRDNYRKFICPQCGKVKSNSLDQLAINKMGMCLSCDHLLNEN